jgi:1-phosphofructokinase family hexose kinase
VRLLCLAPNPSIDRLLEVPRLAPGAIHRPGLVVQVAGGKGLNVARAARSLGAEVTVVAILAGHAGRWIAEQLSFAGIAVRSIVVAGETRISTSVASRATRTLTEFYEPGVPVTDGEWGTFLEMVAAALTEVGPDSVTISGSLPPGAPVDGLRQVVEMARTAGRPIVVDSYGPPMAAALAGRPTVVRLNAAEVAGLLPISAPVEPADAVSAAVALCRSGAQDAVVSVGRRGLGAVLGGARWEVGPPPVAGRFPVGSGDALTAGLAVALAAGRAPDEVLRLAAAAAAANALTPGAGILDAAAVDDLRARVDVRRGGFSARAAGPGSARA